MKSYGNIFDKHIVAEKSIRLHKLVNIPFNNNLNIGSDGPQQRPTRSAQTLARGVPAARRSGDPYQTHPDLAAAAPAHLQNTLM